MVGETEVDVHSEHKHVQDAHLKEVEDKTDKTEHKANNKTEKRDSELRQEEAEAITENSTENRENVERTKARLEIEVISEPSNE